MAYINWLKKVINTTEDNTGEDHIKRGSGILLQKSINVTGTGTLNSNLLQFTGSVQIISQWAELTAITTLTNATNIYASTYDGTNTVNLTADGITMSTATVGSFFTKDQLAAQTFSFNNADQVRLLEVTDSKKAGRPFILTAKNGVDNFIRFNLTTTDNPVDFTMLVSFEYLPLDGGTLAFL